MDDETAEKAAALRALARREPNARTRVRLLAIANILCGMSKDEAAEAAGVGRSTLYEWWTRYRRDGVTGLRDRPKSGRRRWLDEDVEAGVKALITTDTDDGALRGKDFQRLLREQFGVEYALSSAYRALARMGIHPVRPRPRK